MWDENSQSTVTCFTQTNQAPYQFFALSFPQLFPRSLLLLIKCQDWVVSLYKLPLYIAKIQQQLGVFPLFIVVIWCVILIGSKKTSVPMNFSGISLIEEALLLILEVPITWVSNYRKLKLDTSSWTATWSRTGYLTKGRAENQSQARILLKLSLNQMSTVIGWFLVTCLWSNSNVSRPGHNCAVVARTSSLFVCFLLYESLNI